MNGLVLWLGAGAVAVVVIATFWGMWREGSPGKPPWASGSGSDDGDEAGGGHHSGGGGSGNFIGPADGGGHHWERARGTLRHRSRPDTL